MSSNNNKPAKSSNESDQSQVPPTPPATPLGMGGAVPVQSSDEGGNEGDNAPIETEFDDKFDKKTGKPIRPENVDKDVWIQIMGILPEEPYQLINRDDKPITSLTKKDVFTRIRAGTVVEICPRHAVIATVEQTANGSTIAVLACPVKGCCFRPQVTRPAIITAFQNRQLAKSNGVRPR